MVILVAACGRQLVDDDPLVDASVPGDGGSLDAAPNAPPDGAVLDGGGPLSCSAEVSGRWLAFVTADVFRGDLAGSGGLSAVDGVCAELAAGAGWSGQFKAFVNGGDGSGGERIRAVAAAGGHDGWYRADGTKVFDRALKIALQPLSVTERCTLVTDDVGAWTGSPTASETSDCAGWTSPAVTGRYGDPTGIGEAWEFAGVGSCAVLRHLYCFQVSD